MFVRATACHCFSPNRNIHFAIAHQCADVVTSRAWGVSRGSCSCVASNPLPSISPGDSWRMTDHLPDLAVLACHPRSRDCRLRSGQWRPAKSLCRRRSAFQCCPSRELHRQTDTCRPSRCSGSTATAHWPPVTAGLGSAHPDQYDPGPDPMPTNRVPEVVLTGTAEPSVNGRPADRVWR